MTIAQVFPYGKTHRSRKHDRNTAFVDRWMKEGRLLFLEDRVKRLEQLSKPSAWPVQVETN